MNTLTAINHKADLMESLGKELVKDGKEMIMKAEKLRKRLPEQTRSRGLNLEQMDILTRKRKTA